MRMCACRGTAGFAHVSCLAEQATILCNEAEENNLLGTERGTAKWARWYTCSLCEQEYHGFVRCALGWACWKTYVGRPEADEFRNCAMGQLGNGLSAAERDEEALSVTEADLSSMRRIGAPEEHVLCVQGNLAGTYRALGRLDDCLRMQRDVYFGRLKLLGEEHNLTISAAINYASSLNNLRRFKEAKSLLEKTTPLTRRILGESHEITLKMRLNYAEALYADDDATLDDLRKAVTTLEDAGRTARRVFGSTHPLTEGIEDELQKSRAALGGSSKARGSN